MVKRWEVIETKTSSDSNLSDLVNELGVSPVIAQLLINRGICDFNSAKSFFRPQLEDLHDPFLMKDMDVAVARLEQAINNEERILVFGDYDVDGTTAVSVVYSFLIGFYPHVDYYIPDRYTEGYGISTQGIDYADDNDISLIIALDCGIKSIDKINYAKEKQIDFIICDHHRPGSILPNAVAVLDPKREDCNYPYDELSGCGIGFKLIQAYSIKNNLPLENCYTYLDLLAVSIAADIVPITGENRILTYYGLKKLNENPCPALAKMLAIAGKQGEIDISNVVFIIAPRINAAGRIRSGKEAVALLISTNEEEINSYAYSLNQHNSDRKELDQDITKQALRMIEGDEQLKHAKSTVVYHEDWHKGVVGIVASRLTETYYRPTIVLCKTENKLSGSARSVTDFDVYEAIDACSHLLEQFGGHKYAAGLTLPFENFEAFKTLFEETVSKSISDDLLIPKINVESELNFDELDAAPNELPKFYRILKQFAPFGPGNMNPVFITKNVKLKSPARLLKDEHLKLLVYQEAFPSIEFDAIAFRMGHHFQLVNSNQALDVVYTLEENHWQGQVKLQLMIKDIKAHV